MAWNLEVSAEFEHWYNALDKAERRSVDPVVDMLENYGPLLRRPYADALGGFKYPQLKQLLIRHREDSYRIVFVFDPCRSVYLLLTGAKTGNDHWYRWAIPRAEAIYTQYLMEVEGQIDGNQME